MKIISALAVLAIVLGQGPVDRPPLRQGTALIHGRVLDSDTENPVDGVEVRITEFDPDRFATQAVAPTGVATTDASGAFTFPRVAAGTYAIIATSKTHQIACYGSSRQLSGPCAPLTVGDADRRDADLYVRPAAILTGRILDHEGNPIARASVRVHPPGMELMPTVGNADAGGRFEIGGLTPGLLIVSVEVMGKNGEGTVRSYYPGMQRRADAHPIDIEAGTPFDLEFHLPRTVIGSIAAQLSGPPDFTLEKLVLHQPETKSLLYLSRQDDVTARVMNLHQGRYFIEARASVKGRPLAAFARVEVADGESMVPIELNDTGQIIGHMVAERGGVPPVSGVRISATWMQDGVEVDPSGPELADVGPEGAFSFTGLFGTRLFKVVGLDAAWEVVSIRAGRTDITSSEYAIEPGSKTELTVTVARR